jgi:dolichol kinase
MLTSALFILLLLGCAAGAAANLWLNRHRRRWASFARPIVAALALPLLIILLFWGYAALIFVQSRAGGMDELASRSMFVLGLGGAVAALIGGLIGASVVERIKP